MRKEVKVGIIVIIGIALLVWGFNFLKGTNILKKDRAYYAVYDRVDGLVEADPVIVSGYKVGQVKQITFLSDNTGRLVVKFMVDEKSISLPKDSKAKIVSSDILGSKSIELIPGISQKVIQPGDTLQSGIQPSLSAEVNQQIAPLKKKTEELIASIDSVATVFQVILNEDARGDISSSFSSIKKSINSLERTAFRLDTMVKDEKEKLSNIFSNVESITANFKENNEQLSNAITNFSAVSDSLAQADLTSTINNANKTMKTTAEIMDKINRGEGSLGMLINNDSLYNNLEAASNDLDKLLLDLRYNPSRYVHFSIFGRKDKPPSIK